MNHEQENTMEMTYCGQSYHSQGGLVLDCDASDGACPSCLRAHIAKQDAALESALAELADASQCLAMFTDAPATPQAALSAARERIREMDAGVVPELTESLLDEIAGPWLPDRDPMCTRRAERRVGVRDAWAKIRAMGVEIQRPGWSILAEETHELRPYAWYDDRDRLINGWGLYTVGASKGSVPFQRYRAIPASRVAGEAPKTPVVKESLTPAPVGYPTAYALRKTNPEAAEGGWRTCRSCDNYCHGPMNCDGCHESTCQTWIPRPDHDIDGEHKDAKARRLRATKPAP